MKSVSSAKVGVSLRWMWRLSGGLDGVQTGIVGDSIGQVSYLLTHSLKEASKRSPSLPVVGLRDSCWIVFVIVVMTQ